MECLLPRSSKFFHVNPSVLSFIVVIFIVVYIVSDLGHIECKWCDKNIVSAVLRFHVELAHEPPLRYFFYVLVSKNSHK